MFHVKQATVTHIREPSGQEVQTSACPPGTRVADTAPKTNDLLICRLNGGPGFLPRSAWDYELMPSDIVEWLEVPAGDDKQGILQALLAVASLVANAYFPGSGAFIYGLGSFVVASWFEGTQQPDEVKAISPTYSTGLQGNQARLYSVVPKICGRHQTFPPFASQPYNEYAAGGEQYLYVILALGIGNHEIERVLIDDTDITHFSDVLTVTYLPPGTPPTEVLVNVINSPEVSGQDMLSGQYIGGFSACGPRTLAAAIGIDVIAPRGLGMQDASGNVGSLAVSWRVEVRSLNEFGTALTPWVLLANESRTAANREPQRWSTKYTLTTPIRAEIRIVRTDIKSSNARAMNDLVWTAMRAYLDGDTALNPEVAHFEVVMRSSKQLSNISQNRISVIATGMARELLSDGTFGAEIATRNAADWLADLHTSTTWGEGLDASAVDLLTLAGLREVWAARQDRFDYVFDSSVDADAAAQVIAESGRARSFRRGGVRSAVRDQLVTLPRTAFHTRNTTPGSMNVSEELPREDAPDGVIVEYWDNRSWNYGQPIECPCPGVVTMLRPVRIRKAGITGRIHATREGLYEAAKIALRRETVEAVTEMQGAIPPFGSAVRWQSAVTRWAAGDVVEWTEATLTARLSEPVTHSGDMVIVFMADDGRPTAPIAVSPGGLTTEVILVSAPTITPVTEDGTRERTQYLIGGLADDEMIVKIARIEDGGNENGAQLYKIQAFVDDNRVHAADNAYLPDPGEIQDPIDTSEGEPGGGTFPIVQMRWHSVAVTVEPANAANAHSVYISYQNNGLIGYGFDNGTPWNGTYAPDDWSAFGELEVTDAALFEIRAEQVGGGGGNGSILTGALNTWESLGTTRTWQLSMSDVSGVGAAGTGAAYLLRVEIRAVDSGISQAWAYVDLQINPQVTD